MLQEITQYTRWLRCKHPTHFGFLTCAPQGYCGFWIVLLGYRPFSIAPITRHHFEPSPEICYDTVEHTETKNERNNQKTPIDHPRR